MTGGGLTKVTMAGLVAVPAFQPDYPTYTASIRRLPCRMPISVPRRQPAGSATKNMEGIGDSDDAPYTVASGPLFGVS